MWKETGWFWILSLNLSSIFICPQVPAQQHPVPGPGLPEAASVSEHALCYLLGEQTLGGSWGQCRVTHPRTMKWSIPGMPWEELSPACRLDFIVLCLKGGGGGCWLSESWISDSCGVLSITERTRLGVKALGVNPSTGEEEPSKSLS